MSRRHLIRRLKRKASGAGYALLWDRHGFWFLKSKIEGECVTIGCDLDDDEYVKAARGLDDIVRQNIRRRLDEDKIIEAEVCHG